MIRLLKYFLAAFLIVFMTSACVEETGEHPEGIETEVTFSLYTEGVMDTRAVSDGKSVDKLVYAIIDDQGEIISRSEKLLPDVFASSLKFKMTVSLSRGCTYKAVFWAQSRECDAYTIREDLVVEVDYSGISNDEKRDAFWGVSAPFTLSDPVSEVVLKRPFAQLNAGTHPFDMEYVNGFHGFDVTASCVRVHDVPDALNLLDGSVSGKVNTSFVPGPVPAEMLKADVDQNGEDEDYAYLSMSYILADVDPSTHTVEFFFLNQSNEAVMFEDSDCESVTLQRNMHTDFVGQVLSDNGELNRRTYVNEGNDPESGYVYYNVSEPTTISNTIYNLSDYGAGMQFASESGQLVTYENLLFTGDIWTIELGEYRSSSYVNYNNVLNNVEMRNLSVSACIECHEWYFSPAVIAYGNTELNNCVMKGTSSIRKTLTDKHGEVHEIIPVDIGIRNESDAVVNGGEYGAFFAWTHAVVDIYGAVIDTLYCGTCDSTKHSWMTIHGGTVIDRIICCEPRCPYGGKEYSTTMTIKSGAKIGSIQLVSTDVEFLIIEEGASVGTITCEGVEYSYEELRSAMGL